MIISKEYEFNSQVKLRNKFECDENKVKDEPMFFNSNLHFAYENGGPITKAFIDALPINYKYYNYVFDSRVHMLMPGWYPAIPGFHHDDVPRTEYNLGQPDYENMDYKSEHIMALVNADISPTLFATGRIKVSGVPKGELVYRKWDSEIKELIKNKGCEIIECPDKQLVEFDWETFHTGQKAVKNGWRWFGRVSKNTHRVKNITNEIRRQTQVYLEFPMEGW